MSHEDTRGLWRSGAASTTGQYSDMYQGTTKCPVKREVYMCDCVNSLLSPGTLEVPLTGLYFHFCRNESEAVQQVAEHEWMDHVIFTSIPF